MYVCGSKMRQKIQVGSRRGTWPVPTSHDANVSERAACFTTCRFVVVSSYFDLLL